MKIKIVNLVNITPVPAGKYAVVISEIEKEKLIEGKIKRENWNDYFIYKTIKGATNKYNSFLNKGYQDFSK